MIKVQNELIQTPKYYPKQKSNNQRDTSLKSDPLDKRLSYLENSLKRKRKIDLETQFTDIPLHKKNRHGKKNDWTQEISAILEAVNLSEDSKYQVVKVLDQDDIKKDCETN